MSFDRQIEWFNNGLQRTGQARHDFQDCARLNVCAASNVCARMPRRTARAIRLREKKIMENELTFRIITIVLFILVGATGVYHRIRAARSGEKISRREEGLPLMILLRLFGFSAWIGLLIYMVNPRWMAWSALSIPSGLRWVGAGFGIIAFPLIYWLFSSLGKNITDTVAIRKQHSLVTYGPYRWVRHPMYSFSFLLLIGFSLLPANWFIGVTGILALTLIVVRTPIEETKLLEEFGNEYREYMKCTGRFLPRLIGSRK